MTDPYWRNPEERREALMGGGETEKSPPITYYQAEDTPGFRGLRTPFPFRPFKGQTEDYRAQFQGCGPALDAAMGEWIKPNHAHSTVKIPGVDEAPYCRCEGCEGMRKRAGLIDGVALREKVEDWQVRMVTYKDARSRGYREACDDVLREINEALGEGE